MSNMILVGSRSRIADLIARSLQFLQKYPDHGGFGLKIGDWGEFHTSKSDLTNFVVVVRGNKRREPVMVRIHLVVSPIQRLTNNLKRELLNKGIKAFCLNKTTKFRAVLRTLINFLKRCFKNPHGYHGFGIEEVVFGGPRNSLSRSERQHPRIPTRRTHYGHVYEYAA